MTPRQPMRLLLSEPAAPNHPMRTTTSSSRMPAVAAPALRRVLGQLSTKWNVPVMLALADGSLRFNAIRPYLPEISHRLLAVTLARLEGAGLVRRLVRHERPPVVEYRLSSAGRRLVDLISHVDRWARAEYDTPVAADPSAAPD